MHWKFNEVVKPVLANGIASGYWIDDAELRHIFQRPYDVVVKISAMALAATMPYLSWALRREI
ncbi:hypothetical protein [Pyrobaculum calidifontis]|uniref:hypothetical protein n=1 Tax=Pyrobaculum calidifontis TaxID=181486 RepID=UPI00186B9729|nr:hypothetical protein [Pyrobaculum calidifontis]